MSRNFQHSHEVCTCKHVSLAEIIHAIKERNATTLEEIKELTDAGSACGCCQSKERDFMNETPLYVEEILKKFVG